jgi:hypothetical protein
VTEHGQVRKVDCLDSPSHEGEPPPLPAKRRRYAIHPLFPLPEGVEETKDTYAITFDRWDHEGRKERCPDRFLASELTSLAQVADRFGGGTYQFIAYDRRGAFSRWTAEKDKVRFNLPCKPLRQVEPPSGPVPAAPRPATPSREGELIHQTVGRLLHQLDFSLQADRKTHEGADHPDRDGCRRGSG